MPAQSRDPSGRVAFTPDELSALDRDRSDPARRGLNDQARRGLDGDERRARGWDQAEQTEALSDGMRTLPARARALARDDDTAAQFAEAADLARQAHVDDVRMRSEPPRAEPRNYRAETGISYDQYRRSQYYDQPRYTLGNRDHFEQIRRDAEGIRQSAENIRRTFRAPKGYTRSDERIQEDIWNALLSGSKLDANDIEVQVNQGEVTLEGLVDSRADKFLAEQLADTVAGVQDIYNRLRVRS